MTHVFVYGTLKRGFFNHFHLEDDEFVSKGTFETSKHALFVDDVCCPFLVAKREAEVDASTRTISGEIYSVSELTRLDELEEYPEWYNRIRVLAVNATTKNVVECWAYVLDSYEDKDIEGYVLVEGGEYTLEMHEEKYVERSKREAYRRDAELRREA